MKNLNVPLYQDPDYVQGQIAALQSLILGLAQMQDKTEFRQQSLERLENLKTALLTELVSDSRLLAVEHCVNWVSKVTE